MVGFIVKAGTQGIAVKGDFHSEESVNDTVVMKREECYTVEDLLVDPLKADTYLRSSKEALLVRGGWYVFRLPENRKGYTALMIRQSEVEVG